MSEQKEDILDSAGQDEEESVKPRREAMKKMGKYAAYTAPAMVAMLASKNAVAGSLVD